MRERLGESLEYLIEQLTPHVSLERSTFDDCLARIAAGPVSPLAFGIYYEAVMAVERDALADAEALLAGLPDLPATRDEPMVLDLPQPGEPGRARKYLRLFALDPTTPLEAVPARPDSAHTARRLLAEARGLMARGAPELAAEIDVLVREIVLASAPEDPGALAFEGASTFMLWGALLLNADRPRTALDMVQALAHESAHNLLFGLCADGPLVTGDAGRRYASPLRADPRPLDGIVHATFVTARMALAVAGLLASGILDAGQRAAARTALGAHLRGFAEGIETVDRHAELTALGAGVLDGARAYVERVSGAAHGR